MVRAKIKENYALGEFHLEVARDSRSDDLLAMTSERINSSLLRSNTPTLLHD